MRKIFLILFILPVFLFAQDAKYEIGTSNLNTQRANGGFYDYSVAGDVNIKVNVWGFVKYPGKYTVPIYTNILDLISYAGGATEDAHMEDLRLIRVDQEGKQTMFKFNLNDYSWEDSLSTKQLEIPSLKAGDIVSVPGSQRYYLRDWISMAAQTLSILGTLVSLIILITK